MNLAAVKGGPFGRILLIAISFHSRTMSSAVLSTAALRGDAFDADNVLNAIPCDINPKIRIDSGSIL
jgi:hypothetical protein